ncbi:hypothetical protein VTN00DRAFT_6991 [Thermoascus crustaceus]|uniref:uncharacterized protein n=1 Tax=Thermoascus crustaceus TaxID=5088 RepID=UPI00374292DE
MADQIVRLLLAKSAQDFEDARLMGGPTYFLGRYQTPLTRAAESGCEAIVQQLLNYGADINGADANAEDENGLTPLRAAYGNLQTEAFQLLAPVTVEGRPERPSDELILSSDIHSIKFMGDAGPTEISSSKPLLPAT